MDTQLRILILEDVASDAELMTHELRRAGIEHVAQRVQTRDDFDRGLHHYRPALILADYSLPMFDGLTALTMARTECPGVPFIFVSGAIGEERAIEAVKNGATDYVLKDHLTRLAPAVRRALQEVEEQRRRRQAEEALRSAVQALAQQAQHLQILHDVDHAVLAARSTADIAQAVVQRIRRVLLCQRASVAFFDFDSHRARYLAVDLDGETRLGPGKQVALDDLGILGDHWPEEGWRFDDLLALPQPSEFQQILLSENVRSLVGIPLTVGGKLIGALNLGASVPGAFSRDDERVARQIADSLAVAIQNARLHEAVSSSREQLQYLSRRLVDVQENERRYVARELHDEAAQGLTALLVKLSLLERELDCCEQVSTQLSDAKQLAGSVLEGLHDLAVDLRPVSLDKLGLVPALRQYVDQFSQQYGIAVQMEVMGLDGVRLAPKLEIALYRIVQESLTNVARHAQAHNVAIVLEKEPAEAGRGDVALQPGSSRILVIIEDDGVGFDPALVMQRDRLGLFGMRERAQAVGGKLTIESAPGAGTTLYVEVPNGTDSDR